MQQAWRYIIDELHFILKQDTKVRTDAFTEQFTS